MAFEKSGPQKRINQIQINNRGQRTEREKDLPKRISTNAARLIQLEALPRRNRVLHWGAFILSLVSLTLLSMWVFGSKGDVPGIWVWLDAGLSAIFAVEFFSRSGFRWARGAYLRSHFFDFVAIIPALILVHRGFALENVWVWLILVARIARAVDRLLGDGFIRRTFWALLEGFEEEITDRVLDNIIARVQSDMDSAEFSRGVAEALVRNKTEVLKRIRQATPEEGVVPRVAHLVGLDSVLERAEERAYDAIVKIVSSEEVDHAVRDIVNTAFSRIRNELGRKSWKQKIRFRSQTP